jgi:hypothetical protein
MGDLRLLNIEFLKQKYNIDTFVETGTSSGNAIRYAKNSSFKEIHSIDIDQNQLNLVYNENKDDKRIFLHYGYSYDILDQILPKINTNILFWLDAHFPFETSIGDSVYNNVDVTDPKQLPLEKELEIIIKHRFNKFRDIIIIDDFRIYEHREYERFLTLDKIGLGHLNKYNNTVRTQLNNKYQQINFDLETGYLIAIPL